MKKLLLSTLISIGLFGAAINAEALTDTERLQMLQKHAGDIAFVDDTTLADVAWLTIGFDESDIKWLAKYLEKQPNPSNINLLEALVGAKNPDRDRPFYAPAFRRIKGAPRKLAELSCDLAIKFDRQVEKFLNTQVGQLCIEHGARTPVVLVSIGLPWLAMVIVMIVLGVPVCIMVLHFRGNLSIDIRRKLNNISKTATVGTALLLTAIVAKNVLTRN